MTELGYPIQSCDISGSIDVYYADDVIFLLDAQDKRIAELEKYIQKIQADQIAAIAKERKQWGREDLKSLAIRELEHQVKGIEDFFKSHKPRISMGKSAIWEVDNVMVDEAIEALKEQC